MARKGRKSSGSGKGFSGGGGGGNGLAQSGGINHTFGGGKGGTEQSRGVTSERKLGSGRLNNGLDYTVRSTGGNATLKPKSFHVGMPPPIHTGGVETKTKKVTIRKPVRKGSS